MSKILVKKSVLLEYMRKSGVECGKRFGKSADDTRFEEFQERVLAHLDSLEKDKAELKKSLIAFEATCVQKAGYPVGTIREWKGRKYIKVAPNKWRPKYDSHSRGAKMAIALLKKKASSCTDSRELLQLILENRERFSDGQGRPLPFVKELSDYVSALNDKLEGGKAEPKTDYKALQEEFKEEIASGKRNNTKELKEDVDEWKNLIASGGYKGEHLDHLKEIVKIGEAELKRRNDEAGEKRAKKTSAKKVGSGGGNGGGDDRSEPPKDAKISKSELENLVKNAKKTNNGSLWKGKTWGYIFDSFGTDKSPKDVEIRYYPAKESMFSNENDEPEMYKFEANAGHGRIVRMKIPEEFYPFIKENFSFKNNCSQHYKDGVKGKMFSDEKDKKEENSSESSFNGSNIEKAVEIYASDKKIAGYQKKVSINDFVGDTAFFGAVFHEDGKKIATDGRVLLVEDAEYPKECEGRIVYYDEEYSEEDRQKYKNALAVPGTSYLAIREEFPNYKKVIPDEKDRLDSTKSFDADKAEKVAFLARKMQAVKILGKDYEGKSIRCLVKFGNSFFDCEQLSKILAIAKKHGGIKKVLLDADGEKSAVFEGDGFKAVIVPTYGRRYNYFDAETGNYVEDAENSSAEIENPKTREFLNGEWRLKKSLGDEPALFPFENYGDEECDGKAIKKSVRELFDSFFSK